MGSMSNEESIITQVTEILGLKKSQRERESGIDDLIKVLNIRGMGKSIRRK